MSSSKGIEDIFSRPVARLPQATLPTQSPDESRKSSQILKDKEEIDLKHLSVEELLQLRSQIDERLPAKKLKDMDLEREAVIQYLTLKALQERTLRDDDIAANQKAQVANSTASALQALDKMQRDTYTFERFKEVENALVSMLEAWPGHITQKFFEEYERRLNVN